MENNFGFCGIIIFFNCQLYNIFPKPQRHGGVFTNHRKHLCLCRLDKSLPAFPWAGKICNFYRNSFPSGNDCHHNLEDNNPDNNPLLLHLSRLVPEAALLLGKKIKKLPAGKWAVNFLRLKKH